MPDAAAMRRWLLSDAVLGADGSVLSWANPANPGYAYPEAAGLYLSSLCTSPGINGAGRAAVTRVAARLCDTLESNGGVGRGDIIYLFDSAVVLAGLLRYRAATARVDADPAIHRLRGFLAEQIEAGAAVLPRRAGGDGRWSTQFGAHLLKSLHSLHLYARTFGAPLPQALVHALINGSGQQPSPVYVHPFCYEQEGHLIIEHYRLASLFEPIDGALEWLAALQQPDGGILAFANGMEGFGEPRSDATAQAVRLWLLRDRRRYRDAIARALAFLAACQTPAGGLRYTPERDDVCSWSTMFALQAVEWCEHPPRLDDLL
ncbi:MAG: hypothetical protein U0802_22345 [Candidatus Binatia bacterium]